jgi:hypothetical protein
VLHLKKLTKDFEVRLNGSKIKNGVKTLFFRIFALKDTNFSRFQSSFLHLKRIFSIWLLCKIFFLGNQKGGLVRDWFEKPVCSAQTQDLPKNLPKKKFKMAEIFKMVFELFSCMKICFVSVLLGTWSLFLGFFIIFWRGQTWVLFNRFYPRTHHIALLVTNLGSENK